MHFSLRRASGALLAGLCLAAVAARSAEPIPADQVSTLRALIKPAAGEDRWARIPWRTSLWQARQEAARAGKPIVLWEMDGHPLGCT
jgi:hypothetical protein